MKKIILSLSSLPMIIMPIASSISCSANDVTKNDESIDVRFATFNVSFAVDNDPTEHYQRWYDYMHLNREQQDTLINKWINSNNGMVSETLSEQEKKLTERIMQIRNIAAIIQKIRPAILSLNEFNNDGRGNNEIINFFQDNYLSHGQSLNGYRGGEIQMPIVYPYFNSFATNTGLVSNLDLNNDGKIYSEANKSPDDAYGFGYYHGHYAIAIMSLYELDMKNTRTFQKFKYSDMRDENEKVVKREEVKVTKDSEVKKFDESNNETNETWKKGDAWYTEKEWKELRLSSKNHIDIPVKIKEETIHLLLSHPTPPNFNKINGVNTNIAAIRNKYEVLFWKKYINNAQWIYDDQGKQGGIDGSKEKFIILGDLNADNYEINNSDPLLEDKNSYRYGIRALISDKYINQEISNNGSKVPKSQGAFDAYNPNAKGDWKIKNYYDHPLIESITSTFGLKVDWVIPSISLQIINSGVYWPGENELGKYLFLDKYGDKVVKTKYISSDHRLVWVDLKV